MEDNEQVSNAEELASLALDEDCDIEVFYEFVTVTALGDDD